MESEDKYGINLSLVDQNGFTGFGYLTKKYDLNNDTESASHPNLTQDIEGGQEFNPRYVLFTNLTRFLFFTKYIFLFYSVLISSLFTINYHYFCEIQDVKTPRAYLSLS